MIFLMIWFHFYSDFSKYFNIKSVPLNANQKSKMYWSIPWTGLNWIDENPWLYEMRYFVMAKRNCIQHCTLYNVHECKIWPTIDIHNILHCKRDKRSHELLENGAGWEEGFSKSKWLHIQRLHRCKIHTFKWWAIMCCLPFLMCHIKHFWYTVYITASTMSAIYEYTLPCTLTG